MSYDIGGDMRYAFRTGNYVMTSKGSSRIKYRVCIHCRYCDNMNVPVSDFLHTGINNGHSLPLFLWEHMQGH